MQVRLITRLQDLGPWESDWDSCARGVPFRGWPWMTNWWRFYGGASERDAHRSTHAGATVAATRAERQCLSILAAVADSDRPVGFAPWYMERTASRGRVLRYLGTGDVCPDYLSLLCLPENEDAVAAALADWLHAESDRWDLLELTGVDAEDGAVARLVEEMRRRGHAIHQRTGPNCWRLPLPTTWEDYLATLSRSHRRQLRVMERSLIGSGRARLHVAERSDDLARAQQVLIDLHQRRRRQLGQPGCFAAAEFLAFHDCVMPELLSRGQLELAWLELDGRPIAAEYQIAGSRVMYAYQAGIEPEALEHSPGRLIVLLLLQRAIEHGYSAYDFLRGDEPYKAHWGARPRPSVEIRIASARPTAKFRHTLWRAGSRVKRWIKRLPVATGC